MYRKFPFKLALLFQALLLSLALLGINPIVTAHAAVTPTRTPTRTLTATACPAITGHIRVGSSSGPGLAGVLVSGTLSGTTLTGSSDSSGFYVLGGCGRFGMLVTPQLAGYTFAPASQTYSTQPLDFVATVVGSTATPTPTRTVTASITPTGTTCVPPTAEALRVSPVTSPVSATTQVITVTLNHSTSVTVTDEAGSFTSTTPVGNVFSVTVSLVLNATNHLQVQGKVTYAQGCAPYTLSTSVDTSGNPLTIVQSPDALTNTPTATATATRTPTPTPTPRNPVICSPAVNISAPFAEDGSGTFCWQTSNLGSYINSWNLVSLTVNGVNLGNSYVPASAYPAKIDGFWYIVYTGNYPWSHFETR